MIKRTMVLRIALAAVILGVAGWHILGFSFATIESQIHDFTLDNGMKFIVMEDHSAPVISFITLADVGGADDPKGFAGLAHVFEHMAFKGTKDIGSKDFAKESKALNKLDTAYAHLRTEEKKGIQGDSTKIAALQATFDADQKAADSLVANNEYSIIVEREGGVGLNAGTGYDQTMYYSSFPSNKLELWFAMESQRFANPVLRQFYKEKNVIKEERRMTVESSPVGRLVEEFLGAAFKAHPYGMTLIGPMSDINNIDKKEAMKFYRRHYVASNLIVGIAGDVKLDDVKKLAKKYFGPLPKVPKPGRVQTVEPKQNAQREVIVYDQSQPFLVMGYHRPAFTDPDDAVYDAIADYLGQGRTSLLYTDLVKEKKLATQVQAFASFPGGKYPNLFGIFVVPAKGIDAPTCETEVLDNIKKLKETTISNEELDKIKARAKSNFINQLSSRSGMAGQLALYQNFFGDWRVMFKSLDQINAVTAEDIRRVANDCFAKGNLTVAYIQTTEDSTQEESK
jgi:predicted Zn-dependent peptidase